MFQRDYILRMIQQFIEATLRLLELKKAEDFENFAQDFDSLLWEGSKLDAGRHPEADMAELLSHWKERPEFAEIKDRMTLLLFEAAEVFAQQGQVEKALQAQRLAEELLAEPSVGETFDLEVQQRLAQYRNPE